MNTLRTNPIQDTGWNVTITGVRGVNIRSIPETLKQVSAASGEAVVQLFDAARVAGWRHLHFAAVNAANAMKTGEHVSNSLDVETLLYASAQDQIRKAIEFMGVSDKTTSVAVVAFARDPDASANAAKKVAETLGTEDDGVLEVTEEKFTSIQEAYGVTRESLLAVSGDRVTALMSLVVEKCALMPLDR